MSLNLTVTTAGRAALVNASNTGTAPVAITQIGLSESAVVPNAAATTLPDEFKRIDGVAGDVVAADTIHVNVTDGGADTYALRAFALYLGDGTLFAIYGQAEPFLEKTAQSIAAISIDAIFADIDAALITFGDTNFLNPPATTERAGVVELTSSAEAIAGGDTVRAVTAKALKAAVAAWLDARFGAGNSGIWHPGNDGAGSGLDADLLDGKQAAAFLLAANYTPADILAKLLGVDGAGSGLDADLLDGLQGSAYMPKSGGAFTGEVTNLVLGASGSEGGKVRLKRGTESSISGDAIIDQVASLVQIFVDSAGYPTFSFDFSDGAIEVPGGIVWTSRNDGAGSGLDADLLQGTSGSLFLAMGRVMAGNITLARDGSSNDTFGGLELREASFNGNGNLTPPYAPGLNFHWSNKTAARIYLNAQGQFVFAGQGDITNSRRDLLVDNVHMLGNAFSSGNRMWHAGNDGAGSGLDADMLDGLHASAFLRANSPGIVRAAGYAMPNTGQIASGFNVSSITYSSSGGSGNGARAIVTYSNPVNNSVPVAMGDDSYNNSSSQSAFWGAGSSRGSTGFTACFGVSGGGGVPRVFSFITVGA